MVWGFTSEWLLRFGDVCEDWMIVMYLRLSMVEIEIVMIFFCCLFSGFGLFGRPFSCLHCVSYSVWHGDLQYVQYSAIYKGLQYVQYSTIYKGLQYVQYSAIYKWLQYVQCSTICGRLQYGQYSAVL
jgi:hypothetical protein